MYLLANDCSVHEQFQDLDAFQDALSRLIALRSMARRFGREIHCHRTFSNRKPIRGMALLQAINSLPGEKSRSVLTWLAKSGPFWDDDQWHSEDDYLDNDGNIVTGTAMGEAAFRSLRGTKCCLVSLSPSDWCQSPISIREVHGETEAEAGSTAEIENWWCAKELESSLRHHSPPLSSWEELRKVSATRFPNLFFAENCFAPLKGTPFNKSSADRFIALLDVLDQLAMAFDDAGRRNAEGHRIYQRYFTGDRAWFSDSSDSETYQFEGKLTFRHPKNPEEKLLCPWHGKISHLTLRLHFSWPIKAKEPVHVVYAGPKLTKR